LIYRFIDEQRAVGRGVESICRVLREQGVQVAPRTYRSWKSKPASLRRSVRLAAFDRRRVISPAGLRQPGKFPNLGFHSASPWTCSGPLRHGVPADDVHHALRNAVVVDEIDEDPCRAWCSAPTKPGSCSN